MAHGGIRKGSGRKVGSIPLALKDYFTADETKAFVEDLKERAKKSDKIAVFVGEHLFGKAPQPISNADDKPFLVANE